MFCQMNHMEATRKFYAPSAALSVFLSPFFFYPIPQFRQIDDSNLYRFCTLFGMEAKELRSKFGQVLRPNTPLSLH